MSSWDPGCSLQFSASLRVPSEDKMCGQQSPSCLCLWLPALRQHNSGKQEVPINIRAHFFFFLQKKVTDTTKPKVLSLGMKMAELLRVSEVDDKLKSH